MRRILPILILAAALAGCETFPEVEQQILNNAVAATATTENAP